jgi:hypothetical protein
MSKRRTTLSHNSDDSGEGGSEDSQDSQPENEGSEDEGRDIGMEDGEGVIDEEVEEGYAPL